MRRNKQSTRRQTTPRVAGPSSPTPQPRSWFRTHSKIVAGLGAVVTALAIAWLTPAGPAIWQKLFPPPTITVSTSFIGGYCDTFIVPPGDNASASDPDYGTIEWAAAHKAAQAGIYSSGQGKGRILVTVKGYDRGPVTITALEFHVVYRQSTPLDGRVLSNSCGGETIARYVEVDLDADPPRIGKSSADVTTWSQSIDTTPLRFPYNVSDSDTENLLLIASTSGYVEWTADLSWSNGAASGRLTIDNHGQPFRTSNQVGNEPVTPGD